MLIKDIQPKTGFGINLFTEQSPIETIKRAVELPLQEACRILFEKGIETVMSSSNKNNIVQEGEGRIEKKDVQIDPIDYMLSAQKPTFEDAGKGYAWIMLNFDTLSDENKDWLFDLEEKKGANGENIGEKGVWFVQPCVIGNLDYKIKTDQYTYEQLRELLDESEIPQEIEYDERLARFDKKRVVLTYNNMYPINTVMLRYPINEKTTVEEVSEYFKALAKSFKDQEKEKIPEYQIRKMKETEKRFKEREMDIN